MRNFDRSTRWIITYITALIVIMYAMGAYAVATREPKLPTMPVSTPPVFEWDRPDRWELYTSDYYVLYEYTVSGVHLLYIYDGNRTDCYEFDSRDDAILYGQDKFNFFRGISDER